MCCTGCVPFGASALQTFNTFTLTPKQGKGIPVHYCFGCLFLSWNMVLHEGESFLLSKNAIKKVSIIISFALFRIMCSPLYIQYSFFWSQNAFWHNGKTNWMRKYWNFFEKKPFFSWEIFKHYFYAIYNHVAPTVLLVIIFFFTKCSHHWKAYLKHKNAVELNKFPSLLKISEPFLFNFRAIQYTVVPTVHVVIIFFPHKMCL